MTEAQWDRLVAADPRYAPLRPGAAPVALGTPGPAPSPTGAGGPCRFAGEGVAGPERHRLGLGHSRDWRYCLHPGRPLGEIVCPCKGCNSGCPGYAGG